MACVETFNYFGLAHEEVPSMPLVLQLHTHIHTQLMIDFGGGGGGGEMREREWDNISDQTLMSDTHSATGLHFQDPVVMDSWCIT